MSNFHLSRESRDKNSRSILAAFRKIHEMKAKSLFSLGGAVLVLPLLAQGAEAAASLGGIEGVAGFRVLEDGSVEVVLNSGATVVVDASNVESIDGNQVIVSDVAVAELSSLAAGNGAVAGAFGNAGAAVGGLLGLGLAVGGGGGGGGGGSTAISKTLSVIDAPLENALVFYDSNSDGNPDQSEFLGLTNAQGGIDVNYTPVDGGQFIIIPSPVVDASIYGWDSAFAATYAPDAANPIITRDVVTDNSFTQVLLANDTGAGTDQVVSPVSTLVSSGMDEAVLKQVLGLPAETDLNTLNFFEDLSSGDSAAQEAASKVAGFAAAMAKVVDAAVSAASSSGTLTEAELQQITQDAFADAGKVLAVATEGGVSLEDALEAASAVAVAGAISDGVNTDDMAAEIIAAAGGGASIDDAITTAVTTQATAGNLTSDQVDGVEEISEAVATASTAIIEIFEDAVIPTGATLDDIEELLKTSLDDATDAADAAINDAVNEQLLGVKLEADSNEATEGQVAILKGNVLANDQNEDGTALDSSTRVDSVNGLDMAEGGTTDGTSSSFVISTRDWATPERTVSIQSIDDAMGLNGVFPEARPFGSPTRGSAVIAEITVGAGDTISYDYIFASYDYIPYNDYSFFAVQDVAGGAGVVLRGETGESTAGPADVRDLKGPGYYVNAGVETSTSKSFSYTFTEAGTYKIAIGVTDVRDTIVDSKISVSNIELTPNGGTAQPVTGFTEHGNVQAEAPTVTSLSETLLTGFYGTLIINETGDYIYQVGGPNAEPIAEGEVVTDNFDYTVKLPDGTLATQTLSIKVTGTADAAVDAPTILLDVSPINGADMTAAVFAGSTTNAVGETIVLTISDQDPTTSDIIISDIVVDSDGNFVTTQDVSGLTDGELSVTATVNTTNGSASSTTQAELDRTADVGGDFIIDGPDPTGSTIPFVVTGLDADAVLNIFATDGVTTVTMGVAENGADYVFDVSALNPALNWTAGGTITDNLGNEQTFPAETVYQPQVTVDLPDTINAAEAGSVVVTGTSSVPNGTVSLDIGGIAVTGITTGADGSFTATVDVSSVASDGPLTATASVTFNGATTAPVMDIATLDRTADADTTATMQITAVGQDALITIAGLDADATAVVTLGSGFSTVVNANGSFTVPGENASGGVLTGGLAITDALGNTASVVASEGFSPTINLVIPTVTAANAGAIEITGTTTATVGTMQLTISDADGATVDVMPAAVTVASDGTFTVTGIDLSGQVDGALSVTAVQTYAGLTSSSGDAGVKDTDAGSVTVTPSGFAIVAGEAMVDIDVSDLEPGASVVITMTAPGETPVSVTSTANGTVSVPLGGADGGETLSFSYVLTDPVGNTASGTAPDAIAPRVINTDTGEGFQTLQAAIDAAADGETLQMDSGQFNEDVTVDKQLTIKGAQADVSAKFTPEQLDPNMTGTPRGDETEILGTVTIASSDVTLNGLELEDPDEPLTWDESLLAGNPGALDNFTMINTVIEGFKASGSPTFNAGSTATRGSYDGPAVADGWVIENNFIGGVTEGNGGALYLSGLSNASISDNMFWRPAAGHMYVSSLTDTEIDGNFFYHGVHAGGADFDGFGDDFSGNGYGYGYGYGAGGSPADPFFGRNFWIEMKGDNDGVMITGNDGQFNSGGIQLYGQDLAYDFDNITISGNTFRDFVNADPFGVLEGNGKSGFMGAINVAGLDGSQVENLVITGNSITGNADQIYSDRDVFSLIMLQGDIVGAVIDDNILTWDTSSTDITTVLQTLGAPTSLYDGGLGAIGMSGGLSGVINIEGNTFSETVPSGPGEPGNVVGVLVFASDASGTFQAELTEVGNDFTGWADPNALELVFVNIPDGYTPPAISLETTDTFVVVADVLVPLRLGDDTANTLTGTGNNELFFGAGGDDAISLGGGQDIVVVDPSDPAASGTDTITGFDTGTFGSGNPDGIFFASLSQGDLRGDGSGSQKIDDVSDVINVNAGLLIFDNSLSAADVTSVLSSLSGDSVLFAASDGANTEIGLWDGSSTSDLVVLNGIANPSDLDSSQFLQFAALPEV